MGGSHYDPSTYASSSIHMNALRGASFTHTSNIANGSVPAGVHPLLNPIHVAGATSKLAGQKVHESRDNDANPITNPVRVAFDETGSMGVVPRLLQEKMPDIHGLVTRKGYLEGLQISVGAYGDAGNGAIGYNEGAGKPDERTVWGDSTAPGREAAPLQLSNFEADNKVDEALDSLYLERNGGGNGGETAALVWWTTAHYTASDAWDKRHKKGYLFTVGDEVTLPVTRAMIEQYVTDDHGLEKDPTLREVVEQVRERWELYHLIVNNHAAAGQHSVDFYTDLLGADRVIVLEDPASVAETISLAIGLNEGAIDLDAGLADLDDVGATGDRTAISKALAPFSKGSGAVAVAEAPTDLMTDDGDDQGTTRL